MQIVEVDARKQDCITDSQAQSFFYTGFLVLRGVLRDEELRRLQEESLSQIKKGVGGTYGPDFVYGNGHKSGQKVLKSIEYMLDKGESFKVLAGHPFLLRSIEKLIGPNFVCNWDRMVIKMPGEGLIVPWHRDIERPDGCTHPLPIFDVGVYLDEANIKTCLWVIPGSHLWTPEEALERCTREGFSTESAVPVPTKPGDVILHFDFGVHGSPPGDGNLLRRTAYFGYSPCEVDAQFFHNKEFVRLRQQITLECIRRRAEAAYTKGEIPYDYTPVGEYAISSNSVPSTFRLDHDEYSSGLSYFT